MNLDLYRWSRGEIVREKIIKLIDSLSADIICLQEFYQGEESANDNIKIISSSTENKFHYFHPFVSRPKRGGFFGNVIFSRFPILKTGAIPFPGKTSNGGIYADILLPKHDTVRVYCLHLESFHIPQQDFTNLEHPGNNEKESVKSAKKIRRKLSTAFIKREAQAKVVKQSLNKCHYPVIVAGDFNDTPYSYAYHKIRGNLEDAFTTSGKWWSTTVYKPMPLWRIDYLLYSKSIHVFGYETIQKKLSDHKPVFAWFEMR